MRTIAVALLSLGCGCAGGEGLDTCVASRTLDAEGLVTLGPFTVGEPDICVTIDATTFTAGAAFGASTDSFPGNQPPVRLALRAFDGTRLTGGLVSTSPPPDSTATAILQHQFAAGELSQAVLEVRPLDAMVTTSIQLTLLDVIVTAKPERAPER